MSHEMTAVSTCCSFMSFSNFSCVVFKIIFFFLFDLFVWNDGLPRINVVTFIAFWPSLVNTTSGKITITGYLAEKKVGSHAQNYNMAK